MVCTRKHERWVHLKKTSRIGKVSNLQHHQLTHENNTSCFPLYFHYTGCLIGILINVFIIDIDPEQSGFLHCSICLSSMVIFTRFNLCSAHVCTNYGC